MSAIAKILAFLAEHADLVELLVDAVEGGTTKEALAAAIRAAAVETSDAAMREELGKP
jgi:hypothetical protein